MRALLVCAVLAIAWSNAGVVAAPPPITRSFSSGNFALELDGIVAGFVSSVEGGLAFGDVVKEAGEDFFFKKHLGNAGFRDIRFEIGTGMDKSVYNWIAQALQGQVLRFDGALLRTDFNGNVVSRLEFERAQITEVTFPAVDAGSKESLRFSIVLSPEQTSLNRKASGKVSFSAKPKAALGSSFKLSIDGLNTTGVSKVEALTIKLPRDEACFKCEEFPSADQTHIDFPHVIMTLAESSAASVHDWLEDFVIAGNNGDENEKSGALEFLTPNTQAAVFTIKFKNLGIFEVMPVVNAADSNSIARLVAAMYCESMEFLAH